MNATPPTADLSVTSAAILAETLEPSRTLAVFEMLVTPDVLELVTPEAVTCCLEAWFEAFTTQRLPLVDLLGRLERLHLLQERSGAMAGGGTVVLATVAGDVHQVGKHLAQMFLTVSGYRCVDLGVDCPPAQIVAAVQELNPIALVVSGLLYEGANRMTELMTVLDTARVVVPVILSGCGLSPEAVALHCQTRYRQAPVRHARQALDTLRAVQQLPELVATHQPEAVTVPIPTPPTYAQAPEDLMGDAPQVTARAASVTLDLDAIPQPPFLGFKVVDDIPLSAVYPYLNTRTLFTGHWGYRRGERKSAEFQAYLQAEAAPVLDGLKDFLVDHPEILQPRVIYGYTHCQSHGNTLRVYHPETGALWHTFQFPRGGAHQLCLADYYAPVDSGVMDVIAWQIVGLGPNAAPWEQQLLHEGRYRDYYLTHGLFVEMAEAMAEYWHAMVRFELDIHHDDAPDMENILAMEGGYQGCRYSFGYPACPDMRDQEKLFAMLQPERIGITLTRNWMQNPEASTSALVVHHPQAYYFDVRQQAAMGH